jgi:hypothetical protein
MTTTMRVRSDYHGGRDMPYPAGAGAPVLSPGQALVRKPGS